MSEEDQLRSSDELGEGPSPVDAPEASRPAVSQSPEASVHSRPIIRAGKRARTASDVSRVPPTEDQDDLDEAAGTVTPNLDPTATRASSQVDDDEGEGASTNNDLPRPYKCQTRGCRKSFKNYNGLKYHAARCPPDGSALQKQAEEERAFACFMPECGKRYKNRNGLKYHYETTKSHGQQGLKLLADGEHPAPFYGTMLPSARRRNGGPPTGSSTPASTPAPTPVSMPAGSAPAAPSAPALDRNVATSSSSTQLPPHRPSPAHYPGQPYPAYGHPMHAPPPGYYYPHPSYGPPHAHQGHHPYPPPPPPYGHHSSPGQQTVMVNGQPCEIGYEQIPGEPPGHVRMVYRPIGPSPVHVIPHAQHGQQTPSSSSKKGKSARTQEVKREAMEEEVQLRSDASGSSPAVVKREAEGEQMEVDEIEGGEQEGSAEEDELDGVDFGGMALGAEGGEGGEGDDADGQGDMTKQTVSAAAKKTHRPLTQNERNVHLVRVVEEAVASAAEEYDRTGGEVDRILVDQVGWVDREGPLPAHYLRDNDIPMPGEESDSKGKKKGRGKGKGQGREYHGDPNLAWKCYHSKCGKMYTAQSSLRQHYKLSGIHGVVGIKLLHIRLHRRPPHDGPQPEPRPPKKPRTPKKEKKLEFRPIPPPAEMPYQQVPLYAPPPGHPHAHGPMPYPMMVQTISQQQLPVMAEGVPPLDEDAGSDISEASSFVSLTSDEGGAADGEGEGFRPVMSVNEIEDVLGTLWTEEGGSFEEMTQAKDEIEGVMKRIGVKPPKRRKGKRSPQKPKMLQGQEISSHGGQETPPQRAVGPAQPPPTVPPSATGSMEVDGAEDAEHQPDSERDVAGKESAVAVAQVKSEKSPKRSIFAITPQPAQPPQYQPAPGMSPAPSVYYHQSPYHGMSPAGHPQYIMPHGHHHPGWHPSGQATPPGHPHAGPPPPPGYIYAAPHMTPSSSSSSASAAPTPHRNGKRSSLSYWSKPDHATWHEYSAGPPGGHQYVYRGGHPSWQPPPPHGHPHPGEHGGAQHGYMYGHHYHYPQAPQPQVQLQPEQKAPPRKKKRTAPAPTVIEEPTRSTESSARPTPEPEPQPRPPSHTSPDDRLAPAKPQPREEDGPRHSPRAKVSEDHHAPRHHEERSHAEHGAHRERDAPPEDHAGDDSDEEIAQPQPMPAERAPAPPRRHHSSQPERRHAPAEYYAAHRYGPPPSAHVHHMPAPHHSPPQYRYVADPYHALPGHGRVPAQPVVISGPGAPRHRLVYAPPPQHDQRYGPVPPHGGATYHYPSSSVRGGYAPAPSAQARPPQDDRPHTDGHKDHRLRLDPPLPEHQYHSGSKSGTTSPSSHRPRHARHLSPPEHQLTSPVSAKSQQSPVSEHHNALAETSPHLPERMEVDEEE